MSFEYENIGPGTVDVTSGGKTYNSDCIDRRKWDTCTFQCKEYFSCVLLADGGRWKSAVVGFSRNQYHLTCLTLFHLQSTLVIRMLLVRLSAYMTRGLRSRFFYGVVRLSHSTRITLDFVIFDGGSLKESGSLGNAVKISLP